MRSTWGLGAVASLAIASGAVGELVTVPVSVGTFTNAWRGPVDYQGEFDAYVSSDRGRGLFGTEVSVDLGGILSSLGYENLAGVAVADTGTNRYWWFAPGADIDLLAFDHLSSGNDFRVTLEGADTGDDWLRRPVSLGRRGVLEAHLTAPESLGAERAAPGPVLRIREVGLPESYHITAFTHVPAPGSLALLMMAGLAAAPRRRRV